ncbi:class I SAM-dependent methyltransferase [Hyphomicrobium sulfonivorans]|uniref:class I SAM-dependent methyltransferase n=1 Tax=Hyphomicrobium sulfonivorans TaxID=121290 RepID=UPI00156D9060|nr:class I SAM-dependent methyltransferase [Hyphomicrobium sulfonivorans]MBI1649844.1 class I SAM-dependent methyltransferase [Hyphomicrobium sulfonivorans]NSL71757.1 hypothetical protein [Hyphomicrobium sulfonivorans]
MSEDRDEVRFQFGQNWKDFSKTVDDKALQAAIDGLRRLLPDHCDPIGKTFLDVGSGSGLHSVAAARLGFVSVTATDYDYNSVQTTKENACRFGVKVNVSRDDILNTKLSGQFDVVYSWGVLHHTGDMRTAVATAAGMVKPGGAFIMALYLKTQFCGMWKILKRTYSAGGKFRQKAMAETYVKLLQARGLDKAVRARGMDFRHDAIDWLGGYPYESATPEEAVALVGPEFLLTKSFNTIPARGLFGTGCAEYTFIRRTAD